MVQQAVGTCTASVAELLISPERDAWAESSTESSFAEVLAELVHVERVSVDSNFFDDLGADSMVMAQFCARVRKRPDLPAVSIKDVYQHPTIASLAAALVDTAPVPMERVLADVLADVVHIDRVPVDSNFFDDLGADSMVMAQFCGRVRKRPDLPAVSIKDVYQHPTIASLAAALNDTAPVPLESPPVTPIEAVTRARTPQYVLCGVLQLLIFVVYSYLAALVIAQGYEWISASSGVLDIYLRSDLGEVDPDRSLEASADPHLEPDVRALLGRQNPRPAESDCAVHRFAAVQPLLASARREGRPRRGDLLHACADLHRPIVHR
jgi:acyl carrier protein